jgi:ribonucleoside-diphosphate reductase alpha chain
MADRMRTPDEGPIRFGPPTKRGMKSLYHCRSLSIQRADAINEKVAAQPSLGLAAANVANDAAQPLPLAAAAAQAAAWGSTTDCEERLSCQ